MHETQNIFGVSIVNLKLANLGFKYAIILILIALNLNVDPHVGFVLLQLVWPGVAILSIHLSIPDWPSWNQSSAFEGQSRVDTCQGESENNHFGCYLVEGGQLQELSFLAVGRYF